MDMFKKEYAGRGIVTFFGFLLIALVVTIGAFLFIRGIGTFTTYGHSIGEFLFSPIFMPADDQVGGGKVGAAVFIAGSLVTCATALVISVPFSLAAAIFMVWISPSIGQRFIRPAADIFAGIPSVVYGWMGLTILVPFMKNLFHLTQGQSVLGAAIVLAVMIYPTITSVAADAISSVDSKYTEAAWGLGSTRWQIIYKIVLPVAMPGILTAVILGLARAFGEALAVAMVIGKMKAFPSSLLAPANTLTAEIAADMGGTMEGGEFNIALWSMALVLFLCSLLFILLIHAVSARKEAE